MFRKMRRFRQQLEQSECESILKTAPRGVLAVQGDGGYPYALPLDFVYDNGKIYFHSAVEGHKIDAVKSNDKASFCVLSEGERAENDWWYRFKSVIAFGRIRIVDDEAERLEKLRLLGYKYFPTAAEVEEDMAKNAARAAVLELSVEHMTGKRVNER